MLSPPLLRSFNAMCGAVDGTASEEYHRVEREFREGAAKHGMYSVNVGQFEKAAIESLKVAAAGYFDAISEINGAEPSSDVEGRISQLEALLSEQINASERRLCHTVVNASERMGHPVLAANRPARCPALERTKEQLLLQYVSRVRVVVTTAAWQHKRGIGTQVHVAGHVGALQTGVNSTANVTQTNTTGASTDDVIRLIESIVQNIQASSFIAPPDRADATGMLEELKAEVAKPKPSTLRIKGYLSSVGQVVGLATEAQALIQKLLGLFG
jgi:nucleoside-triphosphatase THEP1